MILPRLAGRMTRRAARRREVPAQDEDVASLGGGDGRDARGGRFIPVVEGEGGAFARELFGDGGAHELTDVGDEGDFPGELHDPMVFMRPHSLSGISRRRKTVLR